MDAARVFCCPVAEEGFSVFDELMELLERDRKRPTGERRRGLGGLIGRLTGEDRDDNRPVQRRYDDRDDDDRYEARSDPRRSDDRDDDDRYDARSDRRRSDDRDDDDRRYGDRRRERFELFDD
jgi:hypothetical protein